MNILHINTIEKSGGAAVVASSLRAKLAERGYPGSMFVYDKESDHRSVRKLRRVIPKFFHHLLANDLDLFFSGRILSTAEFKQADIVHCHNLHGWYFSLGTLKKISRLKPLVWTFHDEWPITPHCAYAYDGALADGFYQCPDRNLYPRIFWPNQKYLMWRKRSIYDRARFTIVTPSNWLFDRVRSSVLKTKEIRLIPNGIDTTIFKPQDKSGARKVLDLPAGKKIVMFFAAAGFANIRKGGQQLLTIKDLLKRREDVMYVCIGGDQDGQSDDGSVRFIKKIDAKDLAAKYYAASDVFLLTSAAENFPLVTLEAMACGLPVASFDVGGVKEAITHGQEGYIARYGDAKDLAAGVEHMIGLNEADYSEMSGNCVKRVRENYTLDLMASKYLELYEELIKKHV
jgi:glycosyltransferase involved in cell wall biosynthesis